MGENDPRSATIAQHQTYFCVLVVETLAIVPCLVIASVSFAKYDAEEYQEAHKEISQVIRHQFLFPLVAVQSVWVASDVLAVISVFCTVPYLLLPHLVVCLGGLIIAILLLGPTVDVLIRSTESKSSLIFLAVGLSIFILCELFFISVRLSSFRLLVKKKKAVQSTAEKPTVQDLEQGSTSFSRRSTISINDDRLEMPPRF